MLADSKMSDWHKGARTQIAFIDNRRKTDEGAIYASLIPGNRLMIEHKWDEANADDRVAAAHPGNWQVHRRAYLEFLRGNYDAAGRGLNEIVSSNAQMPAG